MVPRATSVSFFSATPHFSQGEDSKSKKVREMWLCRAGVRETQKAPEARERAFQRNRAETVSAEKSRGLRLGRAELTLKYASAASTKKAVSLREALVNGPPCNFRFFLSATPHFSQECVAALSCHFFAFEIKPATKIKMIEHPTTKGIAKTGKMEVFRKLLKVGRFQQCVHECQKFVFLGLWIIIAV